MTIKKRLYISFLFIFLIIFFIIGVFFYATLNLNEIHLSQNNKYDQLRRVEKLKEYNNAFAWIVLDVITDFDKSDIVKNRIEKANKLIASLNQQKQNIITNCESSGERNTASLIFEQFKEIEKLITIDLKVIINQDQKDFSYFNTVFEKANYEINLLLAKEINFLQDKLEEREKDKEKFIDKIKLELIVLLLIAFALSLIISTKIINEIKIMLEKLNQGVLQLFSNDENSIKVDIGENNELSEITNNLNNYLEKQEDIIHSREELLRNISHELKTPITKGKFLIEQIKENNEEKVVENINNVFYDIEELTNKLLQREKLNFATLNRTTFKVTTLILESLSKLSIDDESKVDIKIVDDFTINGDFYYLTIALKNLIDNAMKYSIKYPIMIKAIDNELYIENNSKKLSNDLIYYIQPFTREPNQQLGHGLGLNIVNKIIEMHEFELHYKYENPHNIFSISFHTSL